MKVNGLHKIAEILFLETPVAKNGFRIGLGMALAAMIALWIHAQNPYWAVFSVVLMMQNTMGASIERGILRLVGTFLGAFLGYFLAGLVINHIILYYLMIFIVVAIPYYFSLNSQYPYGFIVVGITAYIVLASLLINPQQTFDFAIWRAIEISIGVVCGWFVMFFVFPVKATDQAERKLEENINILQDFLTEIKHFIFDTGDNDNALMLLHKLNENMMGLRILQTIIPKEVMGNEFKIIYFNKAIDEQARQIQVVKSIYLSMTEKKRGRRILQKNLKVEEILSDLITLLAIPSKDISHFEQNYLALANKIQDAIATWEKIKGDDLYQFEIWENTAFMRLIEDCQTLLEITRQFVHAKNDNYHLEKINLEQKSELKNLLTYNNANVKAAIKVGLSTIIAIYIWSQTSWPIGILGVISTYIVAIQKNIYEQQLQGELRFIGAIIGGGLGLLALNFFTYDLFLLLATLFIAGWFFGYVSSGNMRYGYGALQANLALAIVVVHQNSPLLTAGPAVQRVGGVLFGILIALCVARFLWPVHPKKLLEDNADSILETEIKLFDNMRKKNIAKDVNALNMLLKNQQDLVSTLQIYKHDKDNELQQAMLVKRMLNRLSTIICSLSYQVEFQQAVAIAAKFTIDLVALHESIIALMNNIQLRGSNELEAVTLLKNKILNQLNRLRVQQMQTSYEKMSFGKSVPLFYLLEGYISLLSSLENSFKLEKQVQLGEVVLTY